MKTITSTEFQAELDAMVERAESLASSSSLAPCSQFPFDALRRARACMAEVADKCIVDAVNATDPYSKWACQERAKNIRASIGEIDRMELDWCNGVICFANNKIDPTASYE